MTPALPCRLGVSGPSMAGNGSTVEPVVELVLPRTRSTVPQARLVVERILSDNLVASEDADDLVLAVTEACANAVRHASGAAEYRVEIHLDDESCTVLVVDEGSGFTDTEPQMPEPEAESGRGLAIMDALVDRSEVSSTPGSGTEIRLTKLVRRMPARATAVRFEARSPQVHALRRRLG